jgi:hypothetical protein
MKFRRAGITPGGLKNVNAVIVTVGVVAVGFYLRFLLALCKESRGSVIGYWVRLRCGSDEDELVEPQRSLRPVA